MRESAPPDGKIRKERRSSLHGWDDDVEHSKDDGPGRQFANLTARNKHGAREAEKADLRRRKQQAISAQVMMAAGKLRATQRRSKQAAMAMEASARSEGEDRKSAGPSAGETVQHV